MSKAIITESNLTAIADAIRTKNGSNTTYTPSQMSAAITAIPTIDTSDATATASEILYDKTAYAGGEKLTGTLYLGVNIQVGTHIDPDTNTWVRPSEYPDLTTLANNLPITTGHQCVYLTYDTRLTPEYGWVGLYAKTSSGSNITFDRGHIENGQYVVDATPPSSEITTGSNYKYLRHPLDTNDGEIQLWRMTATSQVTQFGFCPGTTTNANNKINTLQPCVERAGLLPYITTLQSVNGSNSAHVSWCTNWMEYDALVPGAINAVTTMQNTWYDATSLQFIDFSKWNTSHWTVTTMNSCFYHCVSLQKLDLSYWDVSNWQMNTTSLYSTFLDCYSLKELNTTGWDTSDWANTSLYQTWYACNSLAEIKGISAWDVSNWRVTSLYNTWDDCVSLKKLDLGSWETDDWVVTDISYCFYACRSLKYLDVSWNTSNWNIGATKLNSLFANCNSLEEIKGLSDWDVSWSITDVTNIFTQCRNLHKLDISKWDTSNWNLTTTATMLNYNRALRELYLPATLNIPASITNSSGSVGHIPSNAINLEVFNGVEVFRSHTYANVIKLTVTSLLAIIDRLPTITTAQTITLGATNKNKLTSAQIAAATQKGWTVA